MSLVYSNTAEYSGILQLIEKELEFEYGYITGNTIRLKEWTAELNLIHSEILAKILRLGGTWQFDDSNHGDYPIIVANLVSGQRDYTFTTDEQGNIILDIFRVMIKDDQGIFKDITPKDQQRANTYNTDTTGFVDGQDLEGVPDSYDKTANGIFLDRIPNYNSTGGIKLFINREGSFFLSSDSTKKPGIDGRLHEAYVVRACEKYAGRKGLTNFANFRLRRIDLLGDDPTGIKGLLHEVYGRRERDVVNRMTALVEDNR